jgi:hypothetical protein
MPKASKQTATLVDDYAVARGPTRRSTGYSVNFLSIRLGHDLVPMFKELPERHMSVSALGFVVKGSVLLPFGTEISEAPHLAGKVTADHRAHQRKHDPEQSPWPKIELSLQSCSLRVRRERERGGDVHLLSSNLKRDACWPFIFRDGRLVNLSAIHSLKVRALLNRFATCQLRTGDLGVPVDLVPRISHGVERNVRRDCNCSFHFKSHEPEV